VADRFKLGNIKDRRDALQIMTEYRDQNGQGLSQDYLYRECIGPVFAGSDTTAATIRAAILYIATNHRVRSKLLAELDEADEKGQLSSPVKYEQVKNLPYFSAVIKEVIRMQVACCD
jgi:cytochrome P450